MTEAALQQAFEEHKDAVYDFALRMTGDACATEDVAQAEPAERVTEVEVSFRPRVAR